MKVGVLVSGNGSNLQALLDAAGQPGYPAQMAVVVSNVAGVRALERAEAAGVPTVLLDHKKFSERATYDAALAATLRGHGVDLVCLAGFMRLVGPGLLGAFPQRVLNIHPALLPAFPGMRAVEQALAHGAKVTGVTVHLVDEGTDSGPIVAQEAVEIRDDDDAASLAKRVHEVEHRLYPAVVRRFASAKAVAVDGRKVSFT